MDGRVEYADGTKTFLSGKLGDFCRSFWIDVSAECSIIFDLEASSGATLPANGKKNFIGLPFDQFIIRTTVQTSIAFIASIYPFPIVIESVETYEGIVPIANALAAINVNQIIAAFNTPITRLFLVIGIAPVRIAFDRPATALDPLIPIGAYSWPLRITTDVQAIGPIGLTTFNGWGMF